jgi:hypothetical protein
MVSLAQIVTTGDEQENTTAVLISFIYISITSNLFAAGSAIWATIYLAWMPLSVAPEENREPTSVERADRLSVYDDIYRRANIGIRRRSNFNLQYASAVVWYASGLTTTSYAIAIWGWISVAQTLTQRVGMLVFVIAGSTSMSWPLFRGMYLTVIGKDPWMIKGPRRV